MVQMTGVYIMYEIICNISSRNDSKLNLIRNIEIHYSQQLTKTSTMMGNSSESLIQDPFHFYLKNVDKQLFPFNKSQQNVNL